MARGPDVPHSSEMLPMFLGSGLVSQFSKPETLHLPDLLIVVKFPLARMEKHSVPLSIYVLRISLLE